MKFEQVTNKLEPALDAIAPPISASLLSKVDNSTVTTELSILIAPPLGKAPLTTLLSLNLEL